VSAQLHFNICKETGVQLDKKYWYEHVPKSVATSREGKVIILWNQQVQTDRTIPNNKPDIVIQVSLALRDLTLRVFAITRFRAVLEEHGYLPQRVQS
jgi:hypothetical protein